MKMFCGFSVWGNIGRSTKRLFRFYEERKKIFTNVTNPKMSKTTLHTANNNQHKYNVQNKINLPPAKFLCGRERRRYYGILASSSVKYFTYNADQKFIINKYTENSNQHSKTYMSRYI